MDLGLPKKDRRLLREEIVQTLYNLGIFVSPFDNFERDMDLVLKVCKGRSYREIFLHLLRHGPSRFSEICKNVSVSETQVNSCLKKMLTNKIVYKNDKTYDLRLRSFLWIREKRTKPTILLTVG